MGRLRKVRPGTAGGDGPRRRGSFRVPRVAGVVVGLAVLVLVLEVALRLFDVGSPIPFFIPAGDGRGITANPRVVERFVPGPERTGPALFHLPVRKDAGSFRIFVLGGSAAYGTPAPEFGFARILEVMLRETHPETRFEVVNAALPGINSHAVLPIARECVRYEPDVLLVYVGNEEIVGPYGPGAVLTDFEPDLSAIRAELRGRHLRSVDLVERWVGHYRGGAPPDGPEGEEGAASEPIPPDDPRLTVAQDHFAANLEDICRVGTDAGAVVLLSTAASNTRDCPPFVSRNRTDLTEEERSEWETERAAGLTRERAGDLERAAEHLLRAVEIDWRHAGLRYRVGRTLVALGRFDEAVSYFIAARDMDLLRYRAHTQFNNLIRTTAANDRSGSVRLADPATSLERRRFGTDTPPDADLFHDHVHPTFEGHYKLAWEFYAALVRVFPERVRAGRTKPPLPPSPERCAELLALTPHDRLGIQEEVVAMLARAPFDARPDGAVAARASARLARLRDESGGDDPLPAVRRALRAAPDDVVLRARLASLHLSRGEFSAAADEWERVLERLPGHVPGRIGLGCALAGAGRTAEAEEHFGRALDSAPDPAGARERIDRCRARAGSARGPVAPAAGGSVTRREP